MIEVQGLFDVAYGHSLELSKLSPDPRGVNFVSRTARHNGVAGRVAVIDGVHPLEAGTITVAAGGSVMASFVQPEPYYAAFHVFCLKPRCAMSDAQKLYYCACLWANRYRFSYGRQANRTLGSLLVPEVWEIPVWVGSANVARFRGKDAPLALAAPLHIDTAGWKPFKWAELFEIQRGKYVPASQKTLGATPCVSSSAQDNGVTRSIDLPPNFAAGTITVARNGSIGEAFFQPVPYFATDDVHVLVPRLQMTAEAALFVCTLIRREKYRFNYGRKWHLEGMRKAIIRLPVDHAGRPDWPMMTEYIRRLPFSSCVATH